MRTLRTPINEGSQASRLWDHIKNKNSRIAEIIDRVSDRVSLLRKARRMHTTSRELPGYSVFVAEYANRSLWPKLTSHLALPAHASVQACLPRGQPPAIGPQRAFIGIT